MNIHKNARTTPHSRLLMIHRVRDERQPVAQVAVAFGVSESTVYKWLRRWQAGGSAALHDRSSTPARQRTLPAARVAEIARLRRQRLTTPKIAAGLACRSRPWAWCCGGSGSTG